MSTFRLHPNGVIYFYHWFTPDKPLKVSTKLKIDPDKWDKDKMRPISSRIQYKGLYIARELIRYENAFQEALKYLTESEDVVTYMKLKERFKQELIPNKNVRAKKGKQGFLQFFESIVTNYKTADINDWKSYQTTLNQLKQYFVKNNPDFDDIDTAFYELFNDYLINQGLAKNTISNRWKHIKAIMKKAQLQKLHNNSDYKEFKRSTEQSDTVFLTVKELDEIYNLELNGYLNTARDYFIIGCFTGLRFADWHKIEKSKIKDDEITIITEKTGRRVKIPIHEKVIDTLEKYDEGKLPKKPSNQKMNEYIKKVVMKAGIDEKIDTRITKGGKMTLSSRPKYALVSTHTARRSFATNLILTNTTSPYLIMQITGHKSLPSFEKYIRLDDLDASNQLKQIDFFKWRNRKPSSKLTKKQKLLLLLK